MAREELLGGEESHMSADQVSICTSLIGKPNQNKVIHNYFSLFPFWTEFDIIAMIEMFVKVLKERELYIYFNIVPSNQPKRTVTYPPIL